ncbi:MAG: hypothetical protein LLF98_05315 [Clostridium sp.]|uniref:hypothetical protein n=1 Tax=Clostridium sp. TaxID=1506 RepID=UPI0025BBF8B5|nr:hypothetical protein [Clostridium sp.]MCE5220690.1 hypothetical protein [Clostridium sp.]
MEVMYLKYIHGIRHSIIKEGENILINDSNIIPFEPAKKVEVNKSLPPFNTNESNITSTYNDKVNEEITNFFFDAIHKNYLSSREK